MASELPGSWRRRTTSISTLLVATCLTLILGPVLAVLGLIVDLVTRTMTFRRTRTVALIGGLILADFGGLVLVVLGWIASPLGWRMDRPLVQRYYRWVMEVWIRGLMKVIRVFCPIKLDWNDLDDSVLEPNAVVIGRHRSLLDAILPGVIFTRRGLVPLYTLKEDLRWEPNIDIVGHVMGHRFVTRAPKDLEAELEPIRDLGSRIDDRSVGVIFPEGTFFSERRKQKVVASLERRNPQHAEIAKSLNFLLPPRPGGTLALLEGAPTADVIIFGHVGFESYGTLKEILAAVGTRTVVTLHAKRIPRADVPTSRDEQVTWLFQQWAELDQWVHDAHAASPPSVVRKPQSEHDPEGDS